MPRPRHRAAVALVLPAELNGAPVALALEPKSALNLVTREAAAAAGLTFEPAPPLAVEAADARGVVAERATARLRVAGRDLALAFYAAPWPLPAGAGALVGAPSMHRHGLELTPDHSALRAA